MTAPCRRCARLVPAAGTPFGVRCLIGDTGDQCGDFSCFRRRRIGGWWIVRVWVRRAINAVRS